MKSKQQKIKEVDDSRKLLEKSQSLVFVDFSKTPVKEMTGLKRSLDGSKSVFKVIKKRLLNLVLKEKNIPVNMEQFQSQLGTVFSPKEISEPAGIVYRFFKGREKDLPEFKMLAGFDVSLGRLFGAEEIKRIGGLPSKEILITQFLFMLNAPMRSFVYVLSEIGKKTPAKSE